MKTNFRTYDLAISFYRACKAVQLPAFLKTQLMRASSSVALNLSEGNGRTSIAERRQFFSIAMGSLRECQSVVDLEPNLCAKIAPLADQLGGMVYCLLKGAHR